MCGLHTRSDAHRSLIQTKLSLPIWPHTANVRLIAHFCKIFVCRVSILCPLPFHHQLIFVARHTIFIPRQPNTHQRHTELDAGPVVISVCSAGRSILSHLNFCCCCCLQHRTSAASCPARLAFFFFFAAFYCAARNARKATKND